jgi:hypothetical protein
MVRLLSCDMARNRKGVATMWKPEQHSDGENLRWAWLRANEWNQWPLFVSQPIAPVLLYLYPWWWVIASLAVVTFAWRLVVAPRFTPWPGIDNAVYFVLLRFVMSPLMAYLIWKSGHPWVAVLALFWPFAGNGMILWLLVWPQAALASTARAKSAQIGVIQRRLMDRFGYTPREATE